jgi:hypothetical protein
MTQTPAPPPHPSNRVNLTTLGEMFTYHPATEAQRAAYIAIRSAALALAQTIYESCPPCADTNAAIRKLREAVMTANAAVALDPAATEEGSR